jgi:hypothetical protein
MFRELFIGSAIAATALNFPSGANADVGFVAAGLGAGGLTTSYGPYDDCPAGEYRAHSGDCVPDPNSSDSDVTAICRDGSHSHSEHPYSGGTCHGHGGVAQVCPCNSMSGWSREAADTMHQISHDIG